MAVITSAACADSVSTSATTTTDSALSVEETATPEDTGKPLPEDVSFVVDVSAVDAGSVEDVAAPDVTVVKDVSVIADTPTVMDASVPPDAPADVPRDAPADVARDVPPTLREPPPLRAYSRGTCPRLVSGTTNETSLNTGFRSGSQTRSFRLIVPRNYDGSSDWPLMFTWHWLNASSSSFVRTGELETATEQMRFIAIAPDRLENGGNRAYQFDWPFAEVWGVPGELTFFDDMLACVSAQFRIDRRKVYGVGVSAGALWVTYLSTTDRANYFAAVESLSGGLGDVFGVWRMEYAPQANKFPALVLWGGPTDWLGLDFNLASMRYRDALVRDNHFVVQCTHSAGHMVPPIMAPGPGMTRFQFLWQFALDHPYGTTAATSPWRTGLPSNAPSWCSLAR